MANGTALLAPFVRVNNMKARRPNPLNMPTIKKFLIARFFTALPRHRVFDTCTGDYSRMMTE
jgi:hypothetical protein